MLLSEDKIEIKIADPDDASKISEVLYKAFLDLRPLYTEGGFAATAITPQQVSERMKEGIVWIAQKDNEILGTIAVVDKEEGLFVRGMAVIPEARGKKIGNKLLQHVIDHAIKNNYRRLFLTTTPFLFAVIHLYEQFGFKKAEAPPLDLYGTEIFTMGKFIQ